MLHWTIPFYLFSHTSSYVFLHFTNPVGMSQNKPKPQFYTYMRVLGGLGPLPDSSRTAPGQLPDSSRTAHGHQKSMKKSLKIDQGRSRNPGRKAPRGGEGATRKTPPRGLLEISQCSTEFSESRQGAPQLLGGQSTSQASEKPQCSIAHRSQSLKIWHDCLYAALCARAACLLNRLDPDVAK